MADDFVFADFYRAIYARGLAGERPSLPIAWDQLERRAEAACSATAADYIFAGAGSHDTMHENLAAFRRWRIVPRMLRDVARRELHTEICGTAMPAPVMLAPIGVHTLCHPDGELATARAAAALGVPIVASTAASHSLEEIAAAGGDAPRWYQLYWPNDDRIARSMIQRAEQAGYSALVVTVDTFIPGWKPRDLERAELPFLRGVGTANFMQDPVFRSQLARTPEEDLGAALGHYLQVYVNPSLTWDTLIRVREITSLPVLLKGILHPDDARTAASHGFDGVVVSNHGGRQVDGAIAALDALPAIVDAVGDRMTVLMDSGIRTGADVVKALALGADAVLLGRPYLWGLALDGQNGVDWVLRCLLAELDLTLALCGQTRIASLDRSLLRKAPAC